MDNERSGTDVESAIELGRLSMTDFLKSPSSLALNDGATSERFDEPEVDTVESEDEDGWVGWPRRAEFTACVCCERGCWCGADDDRESCRSWGVLEKAYGAMGAEVPRYPAPAA